jgi:release factor glutamine methyltransferase
MDDRQYLKKYIKEERLEEAYQKLEKGEPLQYIIGNVDFYGRLFDINSNVLIPRFETEELVSRTIKYSKKYFDKQVNILDIGTGSGCIAITLSKELNCQVDASDISKDALEVAQKNNQKLKADVHFIESDLLKNIHKQYDIILSNPPYIAYGEEIEEIVKNYEPHIALYASDNGLFFYKEILKNAKKNLKKKSFMAFEIGACQANEIMDYAKQYFKTSQIWCEKDLAGFDRYIFIYTDTN